MLCADLLISKECYRTPEEDNIDSQIFIDRLFFLAQEGTVPILWLLIVLSILSIAIILERTIVLRSILHTSQKFRDQVEEALKYNKLDALEKLQHDSSSLEGRALSLSLQHLKKGRDQGFEEVFQFCAIQEKPRLERGLNFLATIGSNAPFIGLLGTVLGIMKAFKDLGATTTSLGNHTALVMDGIAEALVATAVGLFVAIPAVIAFNTFTKMLQTILNNLDSMRHVCVAYSKQPQPKDISQKYEMGI